jgi:hypothetical protein
LKVGHQACKDEEKEQRQYNTHLGWHTEMCTRCLVPCAYHSSITTPAGSCDIQMQIVQQIPHTLGMTKAVHLQSLRVRMN